MPSKKNHVFLFRHCVRSTSKSVKLFHNDTDLKKTGASKYTSSPLPDWNVPDHWCTERGMQIMKGTADYVWNHLLQTNNGHDDNTNNDESKVMNIQIVTDRSQRDVDTSFALYDGIRSAILNTNKNDNYSNDTKTQTQDQIYDDDNKLITTVRGLADLQYDPELFSPMKTNYCHVNLTKEELKAEVQHRLNSFPPPSDLTDILSILESENTKEAKDLLSSTQQDGGKIETFEVITFEKDSIVEAKLSGVVNVVKLFAQMMFYSRASQIKPPFLPTISIDNVYQAVKWIYWTRSILNVENTKSAANGLVLSNIILDALQNGHYHVKGSAITPDHDYELDRSSATFIVGHDGNINNVATALGLRWNLDAPYFSSKHENEGVANMDANHMSLEYVPTPPGSAMHFEYDLDTNEVKLSYLYPVFPMDQDEDENEQVPPESNYDEGYINMYDTQFQIKTTPLIFSPTSLDNQLENMNIAIETVTTETTTIIQPRIAGINEKTSQEKHLAIKALRQRLDETLAKYPKASECYLKAKNITSFYHEMENSRVGSSPHLPIMISLAFIIFLSMMIMALKLRKKAKPNFHTVYESGDSEIL